MSVQCDEALLAAWGGARVCGFTHTTASDMANDQAPASGALVEHHERGTREQKRHLSSETNFLHLSNDTCTAHLMAVKKEVYRGKSIPGKSFERIISRAC
jgi:hypothetical protein